VEDEGDAARSVRDTGTEADDAGAARTLDASDSQGSSLATRDAATDGSVPTRDAAGATHDAGLPREGDLARELDGLFLDVPCASDTPTPLAQGATCLHPGSTQHIERAIQLPGRAGDVYDLTLRVRGIWEPTSIASGMRRKDAPFTTGGEVASGDGMPINYQQYFIRVSKPAQTYWLNDYGYVAHDIHREDYDAIVRVDGAATVTIVMNDGNDHQIANWTRDYFAGLAPYADAPSTGQSLRLDVRSVIAR